MESSKLKKPVRRKRSSDAIKEEEDEESFLLENSHKVKANKITKKASAATSAATSVVSIKKEYDSMDSSMDSFMIRKIHYFYDQQRIPEEIVFYYFIGRLNPPHDGHINALRILLEESSKTGSIPLILLGNGPSLKPATTGTQVINKSFDILDNPLDYDLKERFIKIELDKLGFDQNNYLILEKIEPPSIQLKKYITTILTIPKLTISKLNGLPVKICNVAGNKDDDLNKLQSITNIMEEIVEKYDDKHGIRRVITKAQPFPIFAGINPMSATKVRISIYKQLLPEIYLRTEEDQLTNQQDLTKYAEFYGKMTLDFFENIRLKGETIPPKILELYIACNGEQEKLTEIKNVKKGKIAKNKVKDIEQKLEILKDALEVAEQVKERKGGFTRKIIRRLTTKIIKRLVRGKTLQKNNKKKRNFRTKRR